MQLAVIEVTNRQIAPQLLQYFSEVQSFVRKLSCQRPLAHSQTASNVFHDHSSMRKHRRDRVLNSRAQLAHITSSIGYRRIAIFQKKVIEKTRSVAARGCAPSARGKFVMQQTCRIQFGVCLSAVERQSNSD